MKKIQCFLLIVLFLINYEAVAKCQLRGTGDLGIIIERATGSVLIVDRTAKKRIFQIKNLGDLSHASLVYSPDQRYAFIFARDGFISKIDILCGKIIKRTQQAGNSIGGAISSDGKLIAVSNYQPGGVNIFNADGLEMIANIPATKISKDKNSKTVGLVESVDNKFIVSLYDSGEIWIIDTKDIDTNEVKTFKKIKIKKFQNVGRLPYDALITPNGRYYIAGLFGENGLLLLDLWNNEQVVKKILKNYGKGEKKLPVYKMPHLEGWAFAGKKIFLPAVGSKRVLVADTDKWLLTDKIKVYGQPVFVMARPDGKQIWVNFAYPNNDTIVVIDSQTHKIIREFKVGKGALHMEFSPKGEEVWISVRDKDKVIVFDTNTLKPVSEIKVTKPSGIFFTNRAGKIGL
jgi:protein NirF